MTRLALLILALYPCASLPAGEPEGPKQLKWKLAAGQKIRVATQSEMTRTTKIKSNVDKTTVKTIIDLIWDVKEVDSAGVATIEQRPERLAIALEHQPDEKYELDSELLKKNPNLKGRDRDALRLLMEGRAEIKIDPSGVVLESSVPPDWSDKLKQSALADLHDQLVLAATPQLFPGVQLSLPAEAIEEGREWRVEAPKEEKPSLRGAATFTYRGEKSLENKNRDRIDVEFTIQGLPEAITVTSQSNAASFWFDAEAGLPAQLDTTQNWKAEKTYRDTVILLTTSGTTKTIWTLLP